MMTWNLYYFWKDHFKLKFPLMSVYMLTGGPKSLTLVPIEYSKDSGVIMGYRLDWINMDLVSRHP